MTHSAFSVHSRDITKLFAILQPAPKTTHYYVLYIKPFTTIYVAVHNFGRRLDAEEIRNSNGGEGERDVICSDGKDRLFVTH